jgi:hypothetical protein
MTRGAEMINAIRGRASYANVMSTIAVVLALGGGAYAASKTSSKQIKNNTIKSIDQKDRKAVQGVDVALDSLTGTEILESSLSQVSQATSATNAKNAENAESAEEAIFANVANSATRAGNGFDAYAYVNGATGNVVTGSGMTNSNVDRESEGVYCFNFSNYIPRFVLVNGVQQEVVAAQDNFWIASALGNDADCPGLEEAVVESRDDNPGNMADPATPQDADFLIVFF